MTQNPRIDVLGRRAGALERGERLRGSEPGRVDLVPHGQEDGAGRARCGGAAREARERLDPPAWESHTGAGVRPIICAGEASGRLHRVTMRHGRNAEGTDS